MNGNVNFNFSENSLLWIKVIFNLSYFKNTQLKQAGDDLYIITHTRV